MNTPKVRLQVAVFVCTNSVLTIARFAHTDGEPICSHICVPCGHVCVCNVPKSEKERKVCVFVSVFTQCHSAYVLILFLCIAALQKHFALCGLATGSSYVHAVQIPAGINPPSSVHDFLHGSLRS
jgi:hypothetical protein